MTLRWDHSAADKVDEALEAGLYDLGEYVLDESNRVVPLETGDLERSGEVSQAGNRVRVSYSSVYAMIQHEDLTFKHDAGRSAKFLEKAANHAAPRAEEIIQAAARRKGLL